MQPATHKTACSQCASPGFVAAELETADKFTAVASPSTEDKDAAAVRSAPSGAVHTAGAADEVKPASKYQWLRNWWPVLAVDMLHKDKPNAVTLLGRKLVVWWDQPEGCWVVQEDSCPHRLTPLSLGRIVAPGELMCSYHGWTFNSKGSCTSIPQLPPAADASMPQPATKNKRSCVRTYPSRCSGGLVFAWLDDSAEGLEVSQVKPLPLPDGYEDSAIWAVLQSPGDCRLWVHQVLDPVHGNHLHSGIGWLKWSNAVPFEALPVSDLTLDEGFTMRHGGYEKGNVGLKAQRRFEPPCTIRTIYEYPSGMRVDACLFFVPVAPSMCRVFVSLHPSGVTAPPDATGFWRLTSYAKPFFKLFGKVPHWLWMGQRLTDQDVMAMCHAEQGMRDRGQTDRDFYLASSADVGVAAFNKWLRMAGGYESIWGDQPYPSLDLSLDKLLDRRSRHLDHCAICQKGLRTVDGVISALKGLSFACGAASAGLWATALPDHSGTATLPAAIIATALAVLFWVVLGKVEAFKEDQFISGANAWRRQGGLSLVPQKYASC